MTELSRHTVELRMAAARGRIQPALQKPHALNTRWRLGFALSPDYASAFTGGDIGPPTGALQDTGQHFHTYPVFCAWDREGDIYFGNLYDIGLDD